MKKYIILCAGLVLALSFSSCKSSESAYRKAYEKAKAQETTVVKEVEPTTTVVAPVQEVTTQQATTYDNNDNVSVRQEKLQVVNGDGLQDFSVVVGSFGLKANAEGMVNTLRSQGHNAQLAYNAERNMYRVVASTFSSKADAVSSRDRLRAYYPDAWLLYNIK